MSNESLSTRLTVRLLADGVKVLKGVAAFFTAGEAKDGGPTDRGPTLGGPTLPGPALDLGHSRLAAGEIGLRPGLGGPEAPEEG